MVLGLQQASKQLNSLLSPIKGKDPSGRHLQYEHHYDHIRHARVEEDESLPLGIWQRDLKKADWAKVEELACATLQNESKDLQVAAWLTDAWLRLYGIKGLELGIKLCSGLCQKFWPTLYPQIRDKDVEYRLAPLEWLNEKLYTPLRLMPITHSSQDTIKGYNYADYEIAVRHDNILKMGHEAAQKIKGIEEEGRVSLTQFLYAQALTPVDFYEDLVDGCERTIKTINVLEAFISQECPKYPAILNQLRQELKKLEDFAILTLKKRDPLPSAEAMKKDLNESPPSKPSKITSSINLVKKMMKKETPSHITNRDQAYQVLAEVADYLAKIEPHSPTPYLIRRAVSWGHMSLGELLAELVQDGGDLIRTLKILGIPPANHPNSNSNDTSV